jgi:hypothetical protein
VERIHPESEMERKLMCLGAVFLEENFLLDELFQVIGSDLLNDEEMDLETKAVVLREVDEHFFRLDMNYNSEIKDECLSVLEDFWGIRSKEDVLKTTENTRQQGHRTKFNVLKSLVPTKGAIDLGALEKFKQVFNFDLDAGHEVKMPEDDYQKLVAWLQRTHLFLGDAGILAWDASRYVHLVRLSYIANYLNARESWSEISLLSPLVLGRFSSWMEYSQSFLIGRTFWSGSDDPKTKSICERLIGHPASPWKFYTVS